MRSIKAIFIIILSGFFLLLESQAFAADVLASESKPVADQRLQKKLSEYLIQEKSSASPKVLYNLGVINYKLQHYSQAKSYFKKLLVVDSYHLLAKYNLGLVEYKLGHKKESIKWFKRISSHSHSFKSSDKIIRLAKAQLVKLGVYQAATNKAPAKPKTKSEPFKSYVFAYYGLADSVIDPNGVSTIRDDNFLNIYASLTMKLDDVIAKGVSWKFGYYSKDYNHLNNYDYKVVSTDFGQLFKVNNWQHSLRLRLDSSTYGATDYQSVTRYEFKTQYRQAPHKMTARYRYYDISSDDVLYDAYEGNRQNVSFIYDWSLKPHKFRVGFDFEANDRADILNGSVIDYSYSATRKKIDFAWYYKINKTWKTRLKLEYRDSLYNDFSTQDSAIRDETLSSSSVQLKYRLKRRWWLVADYRYMNNDANISRYSYSKNETRIGVTGSF